MSKIELLDIASGFSAEKINENFYRIQTALNDQVLSRDNPTGSPNEMKEDLDMNGNRIFNLPRPVALSEAARLVDVINVATGAGTDFTAEQVDIVDTGNKFTSTNVEGALQELAVAIGATGGDTLPSQIGQAGKVLTTNGATPSWTSLTADLVGVKRYRFVGNGQAAANQHADFMTFYNALPEGSVLYIDGIVSLTTPLVLPRRIHIICDGPSDGFWSNVGTGADSITFQGDAAGLNELRLNIYLYGPANSCRYGIVLSRVDRSRIYLNVRTGAAQYAVVNDGCLINQIHIESTVNYNPPSNVTGYGTQVDHVMFKKNTTYNVANNINKYWVNLEGARHGIVSQAMPGEGGNVINGVIEGLSGREFTVSECEGLHIADIWLEANTLSSTFTDCRNLRIGPGVNCYTNQSLQFSSCRGLTIDGFYGTYNIASSCNGTYLGQIGTPNPAQLVCSDISAVQLPWIADASSATVNKGGEGFPVMDTIFHNPFFDLWSVNGRASTAGPVGTQVFGGATASFATSPAFPGNPAGTSVSVITSGTTLDNGIQINPLNQPWLDNEYVSFMIPIYPLSATNGRVRVLVTTDNGSSYQELGWTQVNNQWVSIRGSVKLNAGQNWWIKLATWNGTAYTSGFQFYVGGINIVRGPIPPKTLSDSLGRRAYVAPNVTYAPDRFGMFAYTGAGKLYFASATTAPSDWIMLN